MTDTNQPERVDSVDQQAMRDLRLRLQDGANTIVKRPAPKRARMAVPLFPDGRKITIEEVPTSEVRYLADSVLPRPSLQDARVVLISLPDGRKISICVNIDGEVAIQLASARADGCVEMRCIFISPATSSLNS